MFNKSLVLNKVAKTFAIIGCCVGTLAVTNPVFALCAARTSFNGGWQSTWTSTTGAYKSSINIKTNKTGITGTYNNGKFQGNYVNSNSKEVTGTWYRLSGNSGSPCQYGQFSFKLVNGSIAGKWSYCNDAPTWQWNSFVPCDDVNLVPVKD